MDRLADLAAQYLDLQRLRIRTRNRVQAMGGSEKDLEEVDARYLPLERDVSRRLVQELRMHPLYPWLSQYPGLGGARMAIVVNRIGNPWRFPGQCCTEGHHWPTRENPAARPDLPVGSPCLYRMILTDEQWEADPDAKGDPCPGTMLQPRPHTGVRSVWRNTGLDVVNGRLPRKKKGEQVNYDPRLRTQFLMPDGIADQVIKHRTPKYRMIYDAVKERKRPELLAAKVEEKTANGKAHGIARVVVAKAILGDLLVEWKRISGRDGENRIA